MSSPLEFYRTFKELCSEHGIRQVLTSGMACVEYGIQQATKDTDWIVYPADFAALVDLLEQLESGLCGQDWRIAYRPLFGAPLREDYLGQGWTSHLAIYDSLDSPEHHLDFFGQPPRVSVAEALADAANGIASRLVVAQMKKTDRDKDWPSVEALGLQAAQAGQSEAVLHLRNPEVLAATWSQVPAGEKPRFLSKRPLLAELETPRYGLLRCLAIERALWEQSNKQRYRCYQRAWKAFFHRWRKEDDFAWPSGTTFVEQHRIVTEAASRHQLPLDPLGGAEGRASAFATARASVAEVFAASDELIEAVAPPLGQLLR